MKKTLVLVLSLALIAGALGAPAGAKKKKKKKKPQRIERVVEIEYSGVAPGVATPAASGGICPPPSPDQIGTCIETPVLDARETFVKVEIVDASGLAVPGFISQGDLDGDGIGDLYGEFCGAHEEAVALVNTSPVRVSYYTGTCPDGTPGTTTMGTITVTFSNMP
jgi:hypothetical protein